MPTDSLGPELVVNEKVTLPHAEHISQSSSGRVVASGLATESADPQRSVYYHAS